ncbi:MAG: serine/threonine protein kinase [Thermogutta sp.]|nr:serine/threonine protein kinase [Thermogutta sp.]
MDIQQLGPYRVVRRLGRGGMGVVFEAVHGETGEPAAVKMLSLTLAGESDFRSRFELEIEALRKLRHPNIVRLLGFGEQDGVLFYVMELVRGKSLEDELRSGRRFSWRETAEIGVQICQALKHAHDRGIIHRDLKPANLLIAEDGSIKLSDFGIARLFGTQGQTGAGSVLGTIEYMAPEQADALPVGPKADLYSLGAVMYALLAGRPPFKVRSFAEILQLHRHATPDSVRLYAPQVPEELDRILQELLAKDPDRRIATASLVGRRLQAMLHALSREESPAATPAPTDLIAFGVPGEEQADAPSSELADAATRAMDGAAAAPPPNPGVTAPRGKGESADRPTAEASKPAGLGTPSMWKETRETDAFGLYPVAPSAPAAGPPPGGTAVPPPAAPTAESPGTVGGERPEGSGLVASTAKNARFITVSPDELDRVEPPPTAGRPWVSLQTWVLAAGLVLLSGVIWYFLQPPTADALYERIMARTENGATDQLSAAEGLIDEFLTRFPGDYRAEIVREYQQEIELQRLERRFEFDARRRGSVAGTIPIERDYLEAVRYAQLNPEEGIRRLEALLALYGPDAPPREDPPPSRKAPAASREDPAPSSKDLAPSGKAREGEEAAEPKPHLLEGGPSAQCLELARRRLARMREELQDVIRNQFDLVQKRLDQADQLQAENPQQADAIRQAVIALYQEKPWAAELVERARRALNRAETGNTALDRSPGGADASPTAERGP